MANLTLTADTLTQISLLPMAWVLLAMVTTVLAALALSARLTYRMYRPIALFTVQPSPRVRTVTSLCSMLFLFTLVGVGMIGPDDPLHNPLPLYFWAVWWIGIIALHGLVGNVWYYINPWSGLLALIQQYLPSNSLAERSEEVKENLYKLHLWPAIALFLIFILFYLVYPSPDNPFRLSMVVLGYWVATFMAMCWFGEDAWSNRGEFITVITRAYSRLSPLGVAYRKWSVGLPGWQLVTSVPRRTVTKSTALFFLLLLGTTTFDSYNNAPLWLALTGTTAELPAERVTGYLQSIGGLSLTIVLTIGLFAFCVWLGEWMVKTLDNQQVGSAGKSKRKSKGKSRYKKSRFQPVDTNRGSVYVFCSFAPALLPIAFASHLAHHLAPLLVYSKYALAATTDVLAITGSTTDLRESVMSASVPGEYGLQIQSLILFFGHLLAVLTVYTAALRFAGGARRAVLYVLPVLIFILGHTGLGLWLLAGHGATA